MCTTSQPSCSTFKVSNLMNPCSLERYLLACFMNQLAKHCTSISSVQYACKMLDFADCKVQRYYYAHSITYLATKETVFNLLKRYRKTVWYGSKIQMPLIKKLSHQYVTRITFSLKSSMLFDMKILQYLDGWERYEVTWKSKTENVARPCRDVLSPRSCNTWETSSLKILDSQK